MFIFDLNLNKQRREIKFCENVKIELPKSKDKQTKEKEM